MISSRKLRLDLVRYYRLPSMQVSLGVVLAFFITSLFIMFAIRPTFKTIVELKKEIEDSRKTVKILEAKVLSLSKAATLLETLKPSLPKLEKSIPSDGVEYDLLSRDLEALAQNTGVALETFTLGESILASRLTAPYLADKKQNVANSQITIRVRGSYSGVNLFLRRLTSTIRLTSIESVTIQKDGSRAKGTSEIGELSMTFSGLVHYLVDESVLNKAITTKKGAK